MADDTNPRYQGSHDLHPRGGNAGASAPGHNDPLAELARLIGQNDPFSEFNRGRAAHEPPRPAAPEPQAEWRPPAQAHDDYNPPHAPEPRQYVEPEPYHQPEPTRSLQPPSGGYGQHYEAPRHDEQHYAEHGYQNGHDPYAPQYDQHAQTAYTSYEQPAQPAPVPPAPTHAAPAYPSYPAPTHQAYDDRQIPSALERSLQPPPYERPGQPPRDPRDTRPAVGRSGPPGYDNPQYDQRNEAFDRPPFGPPEGRGDYDHDPHDPYAARDGQPHTDDIYDEPPTGRRRGGLITVVAVLCLAVVGTAGAFGYRAMFGSSSSGSAPRVILADTGPNKVVPPPVATAEAPSGKISYERVGGGGQGERVVPREEAPVEVPTRSAVPPPAATATVPPPAAPAAAPAAPPGEPRKVRTVTIRPDQPAPPGETAARAPGGQPFRTASAPTAPAPEATRSVRPPAAPPPAAAQPAGTGPLPLTPEGTSLPPPPAVAAPAPRPAAPARTAARAPATDVPAGGYLVQVSSQKSEADARSSFRTLQGKFPNQLGDRQPIIRRADLGEKGVFYRAQIGPFGSVDEASKLCSELKAAGGQCVVSKN